MNHAILVQQLGGGRFKAMTGAHTFVGGTNDLSFRIGGGAKGRINLIKITLAANDTYTMEFIRFYHDRREHMPVFALVEKVEDVYADSLQDVFTRVTGLATHL